MEMRTITPMGTRLTKGGFKVEYNVGPGAFTRLTVMGENGDRVQLFLTKEQAQMLAKEVAGKHEVRRLRP